MSQINAFQYQFDRDYQYFTFLAQFYMEPYVDPETGEVIEDSYWAAEYDGEEFSSGYQVTSDYSYDLGVNVGTGQHEILLTSQSDWTGEQISWEAILLNNTLSEFGQYNIASSGIDIVFNSEYDDELYLGQGDDYAEGGGGNDELYGEDGADTLFGQAGADKLYGGDGADFLDGGSNNDRLDGGTGADVMRGGTGNDTYYVDNAGDNVVELNGQGNDTIVAKVSYSLAGRYVETLDLVGGNLNGTGNKLANLLDGTAGNNILDGKGGADRLVGHAGNDTYYVDNAGDDVVELNGQGNDTIVAKVSYSLAGRYVETLDLVGGNLNGTGNKLANLLDGTAGNNILDGKGGADRLVGHAGNDTYYVDNAGDNVVELDGEGTDKVISTVSYTLAGRYVETLDLVGTGNINATGNKLDNLLDGNNGNNVLNGMLGNDTLSGKGGKDIFVFDQKLGAPNIDHITDFSAVDDTIRLENAVFVGLAAGTLSASAFVTNTSGLAADSSDRIIYETDTGKLFFDRDGSGSAYAPVQFAVLDNKATITYQDFVVV